MGLIYCISNDINDKKYIGLTTQSIEKRWKEHCNSSKNLKLQEKRPLYNAMAKYGIEHFSISIVEDNIENEKLPEREKYWIKYFNTYYEGYNATIGGDGKSTPRIIEQYDLEGNLLQIFPDSATACETLQICDSVLRSGCNHLYKTVKGSILKYQDDEISISDLVLLAKSTHYKKTAIYQYNLDGTLEKVWPSVKELLDSGLISSHIWKKVNNSKPYNGFVWRREDSSFYDNLDLTSIIVQLDKDNNIINYHDGFAKAAKSIGKSSASSISEACRNIGYHKSAYGYYWKYLRDVI